MFYPGNPNVPPGMNDERNDRFDRVGRAGGHAREAFDEAVGESGDTGDWPRGGPGAATDGVDARTADLRQRPEE